LGLENGKVISSMERLKIVPSGKLKNGSKSKIDARHAAVA